MTEQDELVFERLLRGLETPTRIVDVGARWGVADLWRPYGDAVEVIAFDPDPDECARLGAAAPANVHYISVALGRQRSTAPLHVTAEPACSSLFPPRHDLAHAIPVLADIELDHIETIQLMDLDSWRSMLNVGPVHFMKLDVQGAEVEVLLGASSTLADVLILDIEVEWNPIYEGQALFGDVDRLLRSQGFVLWNLSNNVHYSHPDAQASTTSRTTTDYFDSSPVHRVSPGGQLFWSHACYCRTDFSSEAANTLDAERAARGAALALSIGVPDLARTIWNKGPEAWKASTPWE